MKNLYIQTTKLYEIIVEKIIKNNNKRIELNYKEKTNNIINKIRNGRCIIPFIQGDPKTNFLTITKSNIYTKDEPILRYLPSMKKFQPASIGWFEDTILGKQPLNVTDCIVKLYMSYTDISKNEKNENLKSKNKIKNEEKTFIMKKMFCNICVLFNCGIHIKRNKKPLLKYNEQKICICKENNIKKRIKNVTINKAIQKSIIKYSDKDIIKIKKMIYYNKLSNCIISTILKLKYKIEISCKNLRKREKFNIKKYNICKTIIKDNNFYEGCESDKDCRRIGCNCLKNKISCELACGCIFCNNIRYCDCVICDENCFCVKNSRDCSEICKCYNYSLKNECKCNNDKIDNKIDNKCKCNKNSFEIYKKNYKKYIMSENKLNKKSNEIINICYNRNIFYKIEADLIVLKSFRHGYGLFANEKINNGEFVSIYSGEIISDKEAERRGNFYEINCCSYLFNLVNRNNDCLYSLDAYFCGNKSRYINHSTENANLKSKIYLCNGLPYIVFEAIKNIYPGEELLFDYKFTETHKKMHGITD